MTESDASSDRPPKVFICYAKEDIAKAEAIYRRLKAVGADPWLDKHKLVLGDDWEYELKRAVAGADAFVVCLRPDFDETGFRHQEVRWATEALQRRPPGKGFIIPFIIEPCPLPDWCEPFHAGSDLSKPTSIDELFVALEKHCGPFLNRRLMDSLGIEWVHIPAGEFLMGSQAGEGEEDEHPQRQVYLDAYEIMKSPLTNAQYKAFLDAHPKQREPNDWSARFYPEGKGNHPVVDISWDDAQTCAEWLSKETGQTIRLPTEAEWEKAARGADGRIYPWGNEFDKTKCNSVEGGHRDTTPVDAYPEGASPYGVMDMAGNAWEWCADWYEEDYYYQKGENRNPLGPFSGSARVMRGGNFYFTARSVRSAFRGRYSPSHRNYGFGARLLRTR